MAVGVAQGVHAAAIFLHVELFALRNVDHPAGAAALAPVVIPIFQTVVGLHRAFTAAVDLLHVLPARDPEAGGHDGKAVFMRIQRSALKPHVEAHGAADAALGLPLHPFGAGVPVFSVVIGIDEGHVMGLGEADVFILAQKVFLLGVDIRVVKEDRIVDAGCRHRLHHLARTGGAAGMQQHLLLAIGRRQNGAVEVGRHGGSLGYAGSAKRFSLNPPARKGRPPLPTCAKQRPDR